MITREPKRFSVFHNRKRLIGKREGKNQRMFSVEKQTQETRELRKRLKKRLKRKE